VRLVVEAHGGTVAATSAGRGRGATFCITLPTRLAARSRSAGRRTAVIRLLIVDDHPVVARGIGLALSRYPEIRIVGVAATIAEATRIAAAEELDVALLDLGLPDGSGIDLAKRLRAVHPDVAIVIFSGDDSDLALLAAVEAGSCGYVLKTEPVEAVATAVERAAAGETLFSAETLAHLFRLRQHRSADARERPALTAREREVLELMAEGIDSKGMASRLRIGLHTVRRHSQNVIEKLSCHSRLEAVARAHDLGMIDR